MKQIPILIVGAGPTGLVLALYLTRLGINIRIIDKEITAGTTSRALVLHARTLEFYDQLGIASKIIEQGLKFSAANLWVHGKRKAHIQLGEMGKNLSPFPFMLIFPQDEHENFLIEELRRLGVVVERGVEFISLEQSQHVRAKLKHLDGREEICEANYLAGCDGARSNIRKSAQMDFQGSTYPQYFYVADVDVTGISNDQELHLSLDEADFLAIFPLKQKYHARLIGVIKQEAEVKKQITWEDVKHQALQRLDLQVNHVAWFSTYHVHHRLAEHFRNDRVFLLGDAGHIHSPVGGQGMNTGIGDAVNLAWKLAVVLKDEAHEKLLDSYEIERIAFAKQLVATTDRVFTFISSPGPIARFIRLNIAPPLLAFITKFTNTRRLVFRMLSQIAIHYRFSFISEGQAGKLKGGDRMPWPDNQKKSLPLVWNVRLYGEASFQLIEYCQKTSLQIDILPWHSSCKQHGLMKNAVYLIRPDGYIGLADPEANPMTIKNYKDNLKFKSSSCNQE